ncbi:MAG: NAD(P)H-dependent glycerol-3-phosphate dehydrogenase [Candidatus Cloacimonetes bacterium]|nr:NAD(P)H-dependent glycerol-3-phosphate dehydrogenase [Candidatus Cloacimonadota bacterium]
MIKKTKSFSGKIIIIGSGNWGTTLALLLCKKHKIYLWTIDQNEADEINKTRENKLSLPGIKLPVNIIVEKKFSRKIETEDIVIIAIPSRKIRQLVDEFYKNEANKFIALNASKGVKHSTLMTVGQTIASKLPEVKYASLSGPTIAKELAEGLPAKAVLASRDIPLLVSLQQILENDFLKFEFSRDVNGIELAAAMKGLIAIAVGISDGLGFKTNIFGLIITYGLREFRTVMEFLGVQTSTVYGIAGMGDLITTCISRNSRNRKFGKLLAEGYSRDEALKKVGMEVEGVSMAKTVQKLAKFNLSIPLISCITRIIFEDVKDIKKELLDTLNSISG